MKPAISPFYFWCQKVLPLVFDDSLSYYEVLCKVRDILNNVIEYAKELNQEIIDINEDLINNYVTRVMMENNYKLDFNGNFTGNIAGKSASCVIVSLADSLSLSKTLIDDINHRVSIGIIIDGGMFNDTTPGETIDGGNFYTTTVVIPYDVNCIRSDFKEGAY